LAEPVTLAQEGWRERPRHRQEQGFDPRPDELQRIKEAAKEALAQG